MSVLTSIQEHRFSEIGFARLTDAPIVRWRVGLDEEKYHDAGGPSAEIRLRMTLTNIGDNAITLKAQESDHNVWDNNKGDSYPYDNSFTDVSGTALTIEPRTSQILELDVTKDKPDFQLFGSGGASLRVQAVCTAPISVLLITRQDYP